MQHDGSKYSVLTHTLYPGMGSKLFFFFTESCHVHIKLEENGA